MTNNLFLGADAEARFALQALKSENRSGPISGELTDVIEGVFLANDPDAGVTGEYNTTKENLISLNMSPAGQALPRWQALHLRLGAADLSTANVVGFVASSRAPSAMVTRFCLRSERDGHFVDTFFPKAMASFSEPSTHLDILELNRMPDVPQRADWRELICFFRPGTVNIELLDLRLFIV